MNNKSIKILLLMIFTFTSYLFPQKLAKVNSTLSVDWRKSQKININNISTWIHWDGRSDIDYQDAGFEFPKGSNKHCFFQSGLIWGGKVNNEIRVGGSMYSTSLTPGWIKADGTPIDTSDLRVRIYKTRKNYLTADLSAESRDEGRPEEEIRNQYKKDAEAWPAEHGAPFDDIDGDRIYTYGVDIPGVIYADQTLWLATNNMDIVLSQQRFDSYETNIELQATVWAYDAPAPLNNSIFKKYILINKGNDTLKDFYISMWSDPDIGEPRNDLVGCDSIFGMGYSYNSPDIDTSYGVRSPACGFVIFESTSRKTDGAIIKNKPRMSSFYLQIPFNYWQDDNIEWKYRIYNILRGLIENTGEPLFDPITLRTTKYAVNGNPVGFTGWVDGIVIHEADRRFYMSSGPFNMAPGDTQEIVYAQMAARGNDRLHSVQLLQEMTYKLLVNYPKFNFEVPKPNEEIPEYFYLSQNYPNPFNPSTEIKYEIPIDCHVKLKIYDLLGREIATLVDEYKQAGSYSSIFSFQHSALSSGVYIYSLHAGPYFKNRKMLLIK
ncbi:MAG: T9SS type A sorting domain-containing protein [Bacteroidota bacterium]